MPASQPSGSSTQWTTRYSRSHRPTLLGMRHRPCETTPKIRLGLSHAREALCEASRTAVKADSEVGSDDYNNSSPTSTHNNCGNDEHLHSFFKVAEDQRPSVGSSTRSTPIPLPPSHIHRTRSELQLETDQTIADLRESVMFHRLANGMAENQKALKIILHNQQTSSIQGDQGQVDHQIFRDLSIEEVHDLTSVLRRASGLCYVEIDESEEAGAEVEEGIFPIDDL